ncbi:MAG: MFS transporter, partial [Pseudomonadota bacterium]
LAAALLLGLGSGAIDAGLNAYAALHFSGRQMNWLHAAFGLGAAAGPFVLTAALAAGGSWRLGYAVLALLLALLAATFVARIGIWDGADAAPPKSTPDREAASPTAGRRAMALQIVTFATYTGVEMAAGQWAYTLLTESRGLAPATAGVWTGLYWAGLFAGRIGFGALGDRMAPATMVRLGTLGAVVGTAALAFGPTAVGLPALVLVAFFLAPVFPMLMLLTPQRFGTAAASRLVGLQISAAMFGGFALPTLGGFLADRGGLETIPMLLVAAALLTWLLTEALPRPNR